MPICTNLLSSQELESAEPDPTRDHVVSFDIPPWISRPILLRDELAETYGDIVAIANGYASWTQLSSALARFDTRIRNRPTAQVLAELGALPVNDLVQLHTVTPHTRAFVLTKDRQFPHGSDVAGHLRHGAMRRPRQLLYFCEACAIEDTKYWGRSYWRRSHQIPGVDWCEKHEIPIRHCERASVQLEPYKYRNVALPCTSSPYPTNSVVRTYLDIGAFVLTQREPILMPVLQKVARAASKQTGLRCSQKGMRPLLSDFAVRKCPADWLSQLIPKIEDKELRKFFSSIDGAACGGSPSQVGCILALALLYDDADRCANDLLSAAESAKNQNIEMRQPRPQTGYWSSVEVMEQSTRHYGVNTGVNLATSAGLTIQVSAAMKLRDLFAGPDES